MVEFANWKVKPEKYEVREEPLGEGSNARVFLLRNKED